METWKAEDAANLQKKQAFILDVREPEERLNNRFIADTMNIPVGELKSKLDLLPSKDQTIYIYCESGMRSQTACMVLDSKGYKTSNLMGGYRSYHAYKATVK
jgi:rhodanese-related sulfurtransferase